jgi:hypothetical protein
MSSVRYQSLQQSASKRPAGLSGEAVHQSCAGFDLATPVGHRYRVPMDRPFPSCESCPGLVILVADAERSIRSASAHATSSDYDFASLLPGHVEPASCYKPDVVLPDFLSLLACFFSFWVLVAAVFAARPPLSLPAMIDSFQRPPLRATVLHPPMKAVDKPSDLSISRAPLAPFGTKTCAHIVPGGELRARESESALLSLSQRAR